MAVTVQVPAVVTLRSDPVTVQPVAVPSVATKVMAPLPEPPDVVSGSGVPTVPVSEVMVSAVWVPETEGDRGRVRHGGKKGGVGRLNGRHGAGAGGGGTQGVGRSAAHRAAGGGAIGGHEGHGPVTRATGVVSVSGVPTTPAMDVTIRGACDVCDPVTVNVND